MELMVQLKLSPCCLYTTIKSSHQTFFQAKTRVKLNFIDAIAKFWDLQVCGTYSSFSI